MPRKIAALILLLTASLISPLPAQNPPATATAPASPRGFDPASIRESILSRFKTALAPTDQEWTRIEPKLTKVFLLQLDVTILPNSFGGGPMRGFLGPGGIRGMVRSILDPDALPSQVEEKSQDLQQLIDNNELSTSAYANALSQLRKAREKAQTSLDAAQKDLTPLLTLRQQATLVQMGILD